MQKYCNKFIHNQCWLFIDIIFLFNVHLIFCECKFHTFDTLWLKNYPLLNLASVTFIHHI